MSRAKITTEHISVLPLGDTKTWILKVPGDIVMFNAKPPVGGIKDHMGKGSPDMTMGDYLH